MDPADDVVHENAQSQPQPLELKIHSLADVEIEPEYATIVELQDRLVVLEEEGIKDLADWISTNFKYQEHFNIVASELNIYAKIRIKKLQIYSQLAHQLSIQIPDFKYHLYLKSHGRLLRSLYKKAIFSDKEMQDKLIRMPQQVGFFLPDEKILPPQKVVKQYFPIKQWDTLKANNWELFSQLIGYGYEKNTPSYYLKYDKVDQILEVIKQNPDFVKSNLQDSMFSEFVEKGDKYSVVVKQNRPMAPLAFAAYYGSVQCVKALIENGAEIDKNAVAKTSCGGSLEIYELLKERGADFSRGLYPALNFRQHKLFDRLVADYGLNPMPIIDCAGSGSLRQIMFCIQNGTDINYPSDNHGTGLIEAAYRGNYATCQYLLNHGADVNRTMGYKVSKDNPTIIPTKETALVRATKIGDVEIMKLLISKGASFDCRYKDSTLLELCAQKGREDAAKILLHRDYDVSKEPEEKKVDILRSVVRTQNTEMVKILAEYGLKPVDGPETTKTYVQLALEDPDPDPLLIKTLTSNGASPNAAPAGKCVPPIFTAIRKKKTEVVRALIEAGARLDVTVDNDNALDCAIKQKAQDIIDILRDQGLTETPKAPPQQRQQKQMKKRDQAAPHPPAPFNYNGPHYPEQMPKALINEMSEKDALTKMATGGMQRSDKDADGRSPLHMAAMLGYEELADKLIKNRFDVNARDKFGETPLHLALIFGHDKIAESLINRRPLIDQKDELERAPIHIAVKNDNVEIAKLLIKNGCNVNAASKHVSTPLTLAVSQDMRNVLQRAGGV